MLVLKICRLLAVSLLVALAGPAEVCAQNGHAILVLDFDGVALGMGLFNPRYSDELTRSRFEVDGVASSATRIVQLVRRETTIRPAMGSSFEVDRGLHFGVGLAVPVDTLELASTHAGVSSS